MNKQSTLGREQRWSSVLQGWDQKSQGAALGLGRSLVSMQAGGWNRLREAPLRTWRMLMDERLDMSHQHACAAQMCRWLHQWKCGQEDEGGCSVPLVCSADTPPGTLHPAGGPQHRKNMDLWERVQRRATKKLSGW